MRILSGAKVRPGAGLRLTAAGARGAPSGLPSWLGNIGEWSTVSGGTLAASGVQQDFSSGLGVFAYSGGVVNSVGLYDGSTFVDGHFLVLWGGGHADYSGNEVYAFGPLESSSPSWRRLRDRTNPAPTNVNEDGSGNPVSRHTYGDIQYIPSTNEMITPGGKYRYSDSGGVTVAHVYNFDVASPNSNTPWETRGSGLVSPQYCAYESSSGRIWFRQNVANVVGYYTLSNNTITTADFKSPVISADGHAVIDSNRGLWIAIGGSTLQFYRTNNGTANDYYSPTTTGTAPTGTCTLLYDPVDDVIRVWNNNGRQLWTLTPPGTNPYQGGNAWTWSSTTPGSGATPGAANGTGTYGRFGYVNTGTFRGYVLCNTPTQDVYFYRAA